MANRHPVLLVRCFLVLALVAVKGQQYSSGSWLVTCALDEAAFGQLVCKVAGSVRLIKERVALTVGIRQHLLILGQPDEHEGATPTTPTVDFAGGVALYSILPNASVTIRRLLLASALLPEAYPLPASSFLAIRAFDATPSGATRSAPEAASPVATAGALVPAPLPPLRLEDVSITTPSCIALALHQEFACRASPSPNFTVTPRSLHVLSYDTPTVQARNVTLTCSGTPLPYPCTAYVANSARDLAAALAPPSASDDSPDAAIYVLLTQSIALAGAWGAQPAPTEVSRRPITIAGLPAGLASPAPTANVTTFQAPPTVLDLSGTLSLLPLTPGSQVQLHNLTLINPPYGPPSSYPSGLLTLPLWTFDFMRHLVGQDRSRWRLLGRGLAVELPAEELALWHVDATGTVPPQLAGCQCALDNSIFTAGNSSGRVDWSKSGAVPLPGGGLFLPNLRTVYAGLQLFQDLTLLPVRGTGAGASQSGCGQGSGATGQPAGIPAPVPANAGPLQAAAAAPPSPPPKGAAPPAAAPLCQLQLGRSAAPADMMRVEAYARTLTPAMVTRYADAQWPLNVSSLVLWDDAAFLYETLPANYSFAYMSFAHAQAQLSEDQLWLGDPLGPRLLHLSFVPAAVNLRGENGSLLLRQLVLAGLPPAGVHPTSKAYVAPPPAAPMPPPLLQAGAASAGAVPALPPPPPQASAAALAPAGRRMLGAAVSGAATCEGTARLSASGLAPRRRAQISWINGTWGIRGAAAGVDPTAGLPPGLANLTSCLWSLDMDRSPGVAPLKPGFPRAYLDSVVLLLPPEELALIAAAAARSLAEAAGQDSPASLAAAGGAAAEAVLSALRGWLATSTLAGGTSVASLTSLVGRLTAKQQQPARGTAASSESESSSSPGTDAATEGPQEWAALVFDSLSWCGLAGRNVTLAAEPHPTWGGQLTGWGALWSEAPLELPLRAAVRAPSPPASSPPPTPQPQAPTPSRTHPGVTFPAVPDAPTALGSVAPGSALPPAHVPPPSPLLLPPEAGLRAEGRNVKALAAAATVSCCAALGLGGLLLLVLHRAKRWRTESICGSAGMADTRVKAPEKPSLEAAGEHGSGGHFISGSSGIGSNRGESGGTPFAATRQGSKCEGGSISSASSVSGVSGGNAAIGVSLPNGSVGRSSSNRNMARVASGSKAPVARLAALYEDMDVLSRELMLSPPLPNGSGGGGGGSPQPNEADWDSGLLATRQASAGSAALESVSSHMGRTALVGGGTGAGDVAGVQVAESPQHTHQVMAAHRGGSDGRLVGSPPPSSCQTGGLSWACRSPGGGGRPSRAKSSGAASCSGGLEVLGELGRGAQGVVFRGRWRGLDVAMKNVTFTQSGGDPRVNRLITEAAISASLSHPHVVATYTHQLCRAEPDPPPPSRDAVGQKSSGSSLTEAEAVGGASGGEAAVWRLTLVQELCDGGSLRHCLDSGLLAVCRMLPGARLPSAAGTAAALAGLAWAPVELPWRRGAPAAPDTPPTPPTPPTGATQACMAWAPVKLPWRRATSVTAVAPPTCRPMGWPGRSPAEADFAGLSSPGGGGGAFSLGADASPLPSACSVTVTLAPTDDERSQESALLGTEECANAGQPGASPAAAPPLSVSLLLALQVARGMAYLHSLGVLHGDLSSANVLLKSTPQPAAQERRAQQEQQGEQLQARKGPALFAQSLLMAALLPVTAAGDSAASASGGGDGGTTGPVEPPRQQAGEAEACGAGGALHGQPPAPAPVGCGYVAKVSDFGLSGRLEAGQTHLSGDCRRSLLYSAPELVHYGTASKASDVYAFAVLLYELVCGASLPALLRHPLRGPGLRAWLAAQEAPGAAAAALPPGLLVWPPGCPAGVAALAAECLAERSAGRPAFEAVCGRLEAELAACAGGAARRATRPSRGW